MQDMTGNLFCFGLGYCAVALARRLRDQDWRVSGTTREKERLVALTREGFDARQWRGGAFPSDLTSPLEQADAVLISIPPDSEGDPVLRAGSAVLRRCAPQWRWLGYLSTTGVYGDKKGAWVDETTPPAPSGPRGALRLAAEIAWQEFAAETGAPLHIFRLAGIYGPGRSAFEALRAGNARRFDKPGHVFSRIHVDDVAQVLAASLARPNAGSIYNVCDNEPASQADVIAYAARLLQVPSPPLESFAAASSELSEMTRSFYQDSKRVRNDRIARELGVRLAYPTYREGLADLLAAK